MRGSDARGERDAPPARHDEVSRSGEAGRGRHHVSYSDYMAGGGWRFSNLSCQVSVGSSLQMCYGKV